MSQSTRSIDGCQTLKDRGAGGRLHGIDRVAIQCSKHLPITGSSYIPTPKFIERRKAILNVQNKDDDLCFLYSVLAHIHKIEHTC